MQSHVWESGNSQLYFSDIIKCILLLLLSLSFILLLNLLFCYSLYYRSVGARCIGLKYRNISGMSFKRKTKAFVQKINFASWEVGDTFTWIYELNLNILCKRRNMWRIFLIEGFLRNWHLNLRLNVCPSSNYRNKISKYNELNTDKRIKRQNQHTYIHQIIVK